MSQFFMVVNERLQYARYIRCGVDSELMLYIPSSRTPGTRTLVDGKRVEQEGTSSIAD